MMKRVICILLLLIMAAPLMTQPLPVGPLRRAGGAKEASNGSGGARLWWDVGGRREGREGEFIMSAVVLVVRTHPAFPQHQGTPSAVLQTLSSH